MSQSATCPGSLRSFARCLPLVLTGVLTLAGCGPEQPPTEPTDAAGPALAVVGAYQLINLGTLAGGTSVAYDINNKGQVVGFTQNSARQHAFLWSDGTMRDLGTLGGVNSQANAINNAGVVVGWSETKTGEQHAFRWKGGVMTDLGTPGGSNSQALDINTDGQIVGFGEAAKGSFINHAFIVENGVMRDLLPDITGDNIAERINDRGQVIGQLHGDGLQGFVWTSGNITFLERGFPFAINRGGQVAGYEFVTPSNPNQDAFELAILWKNGVTTTLGTLGGLESHAYGINTGGQIVGVSNTSNGKNHGFVYQAGTMTDLGTLGGSTSIAYGINTAGWIVGASDTKAGTSRATLWKPR